MQSQAIHGAHEKPVLFSSSPFVDHIEIIFFRLTPGARDDLPLGNYIDVHAVLRTES